MELDESIKQLKKKSQNNSKSSKRSYHSNKPLSPKTLEQMKELFQSENKEYNLLQNEVTKQKNPPEQIKDYYKVVSIDDSNLPLKKKIICQKFINFYGEHKKDLLIDDTKVTIYLQDFWAHTLLYPNDSIFIAALYDKSLKSYIVKMNTVNSPCYGPYGAVKAFLKSFIVVNPDISIIPTYIKAAKNCVRYAFLKNCIKSVSDIDITLSTIVGEIVHELFETLLSYIKRDDKECDMVKIYKEMFIEKGAHKIMKQIMLKEDFTFKASLIGVSENLIMAESEKFISSIKKFFEEYVLTYEELSLVGYGNNKSKIQDKIKGGIKVINFLSSEEKLISPVLGIQGNMDVYVEFQEGKRRYKGAMEIKTGEIKYNTIEYDSVQILLYSLLLGQCHNDDADKGLLIYLREGVENEEKTFQKQYNNNNKFVVEIEFLPGVLVGAITKRNELSHYLKTKFIPDEKNINYKKNLNKISTHKILKLNVPRVLPEFTEEGKRSHCTFCFKRQKDQCHALYYLNEAESDKYNSETKKYFNFYYNILNNESNKNYEELSNNLFNFNISEFSLFTLIGVSECEKDSTNKSYSFEFSLKQNKIIKYNDEEEEDNNIKDDLIDDIKMKNNFSFEKKTYVIYIENIKKYLLGFRIKSNIEDKIIQLQVPKIYCSPYDSKENENINIEKVIHKYLNEIKTNRKVYLKEADIQNDYNYSLNLGNLLSFMGEPKNDRLEHTLERIKQSINEIKTKYKKIELEDEKTKNFKIKNQKKEEKSLNNKALTNKKNMQIELEKEEMNKKKVKEQIEENNRILSLQSYLVGNNLAKPQFYGSKDNILNLFDYFIKNSPSYIKEYDMLNNQQKKAFIFANTADKYLLIQGFPGSGKTTFITFLLRGLLVRKLKCLFIARTNVAVDNVCLKLKNKKISFIRIAPLNSDLVHPEIKKYILDLHQFKTIEEYENHINNTKIFCTTTASIGHKIFQNIFFDYGIFDEVCQTFEPELLGPLILCDKFIFVGDPYQLKAPMKTIPMKEQVPTLFERLRSHHKNAFVKFSVQYRMNEKICELSSKCVYKGEMKCDEINKNNKLLIDFKTVKKNKKLKTEEMKYIIDFDCFKDILDPYKPVVFVEYNKLFKEKELKEANYINKFEAALIKEILEMIKLSNFNLDDIGIITPFLKQEKFLSKELENIGFNNVYTIDKSQGSEKEIIIISFVKTNFNKSIVNELARINVAFTRAKNKLIIFGVRNVLEKFDNINKYLKQMEEMNAIYDLKEKRYI